MVTGASLEKKPGEMCSDFPSPTENSDRNLNESVKERTD